MSAWTSPKRRERTPVGLEARRDGRVQPPQQRALLGTHGQAVLPAAPVALRAERVLVVPDRPVEARRARPGTGVRVHAGRDGAERAEAGDRLPALRIRLDARQPIEQDDVAAAEAVRRDLHDALAGRRRDGDAGVDGAVVAERVEPPELGLDLGCGAVAGPVHAQGVGTAGLGVVDAVRVVLGDVAERSLRARRQAEAGDRRRGEVVDALLLLARGGHGVLPDDSRAPARLPPMVGERCHELPAGAPSAARRAIAIAT